MLPNVLRGAMLVLVLPLLAGAASAAPPFNCSTAQEPAEIAVCDSAELGVLDREMNRLYFVKRDGLKAAGKLVEADELRNDQRGFLKSRNACGYDVSCLTGLYKKRNELLAKP
jgi:uncharacterized protein